MNSVSKLGQLSPLWRQLCTACVARENRTTLARIFSRSLDKQSTLRFSHLSPRKCAISNVFQFDNSVRQHGERDVVSTTRQSDVGDDEAVLDVGTSRRRLRRRPMLTSKEVDESEVEQQQLHDWNDSLAERTVLPDEVRSHFPRSFNLAAYVDRSESLQQLVRLGVDLSRLEKMKDVASWLVKLDYERDMAAHIRFLHENGVAVDQIGYFLSRNPRVFDVPIDDLQVRINYLESKKFDRESIARILSKAPQFIQNSTKQIDHRLGVFQKEFNLSGDEVRHLATRMPKVILCNFRALSETKFALKEQMGFSDEEMKVLLLKKPKIYVLNRKSLFERFDYIHNELGISHAAILDFPGCLVLRKFLVMQRHLFLVALNRAQYDPKQPLYVCLRDLCTGSDGDFCNNVAKTSVAKFNKFLFTL